MQKLTFFLALTSLFAFVNPANSQSDPILFTVSDMEVPLSEFQYIYTKNNRDQADYSQSSVMEYLDLYTRFKLKVKRAHDLQLDTITALQKELAGYRSQLAKSYLNDKEVIDKLTFEAYERMKWDLHVAQILIKLPATATAEEVVKAREKAATASRRAKAGEDFAALAKELSEDPKTSATGGDIGYLTAMLPSGFYQVENAIYALKDGEVSEPVQTSMGLHIFKVLGRRPARGEIEAAHILVRVKADGSNEAVALQKIKALHQNLRDGKNFEELASTVSDDQQTAKRGGYIGRFGINAYDPAFEDAAFALTTNGSYSEPIRTRVGYHIIRLMNRFPLGTYEDEKNRLEAKITRDERVSVAKTAMIEKIKVESGMKEMTSVRDTFISALKEDFLTFQWAAPEMKPTTLLTFTDGTQKTTLDFSNALRAKARERMRGAKTSTPQEIATTMYNEWVNEVLMQYEESNLEKKYPDFKALMREYEEGILLFEVTKTMVWDKASQDSAGLAAFHAQHREDYMWPDRADIVHVTIEGPQSAKVAAKVRKMLSKQSIEAIAAKLNKKSQQVTFMRKRYTREDMSAQGLTWQKGWISETETMTDTGHQKFSVVTELLPPQPKALEEARGYVIADYQDHLEKEWVESLRAMYPVTVNQSVLSSLIRS